MHPVAVVARPLIVAVLVAIGLGGVAAQRVAAQDAGAGTITVTVTSYDFIEPDSTDDSPDFPAPYSYGQSFPAMQGGITRSAPGTETILVIAAAGGQLGEGTIGDDASVAIEITAGIPFFIIDADDTGEGSYVVSGETDEPWNMVRNLTPVAQADPSDTVGQGDGPGGAALAQLEIATYACPDGYVVPEDDAIGSATGSCTAPQAGVDVSVRPRIAEAQPTVLTTGATGYAVSGLPASESGYDLQLTLPTAALGYLVNCTRTDGGDPGVVYTEVGFQIQAAAETGAEIGCDVFFVFADAAAPNAAPSTAPSVGASSAPSAAPSAAASGAGVVGLPNTGTGSARTATMSFALVAVALLALAGLAFSVFARTRSTRIG